VDAIEKLRLRGTSSGKREFIRNVGDLSAKRPLTTEEGLESEVSGEVVSFLFLGDVLELSGRSRGRRVNPALDRFMVPNVDPHQAQDEKQDLRTKSICIRLRG
jgi:hypothetical protein